MDDIIPQDTSQKQCSKCEQCFPATTKFFHRDKGKPDGFARWCKVCVSQHHQEYRQRPGVRERQQAYMEGYTAKRQTPEARAKQKAYRDNPDIKKHRQEYGRNYYIHNRETIVIKKLIYESRSDVSERSRIYHHNRYLNNRERHRAASKIYRSLPQSILRKKARDGKRRANKQGVDGAYTAAQIQEQLKRQKYHCYYAACGHAKFEKRKGKYIYHIEHTYPLSRVVGTDIPANDISYLVLACPSCNLKKNDKFPWEWPEGGRLL